MLIHLGPLGCRHLPRGSASGILKDIAQGRVKGSSFRPFKLPRRAYGLEGPKLFGLGRCLGSVVSDTLQLSPNPIRGLQHPIAPQAPKLECFATLVLDLRFDVRNTASPWSLIVVFCWEGCSVHQTEVVRARLRQHLVIGLLQARAACQRGGLSAGQTQV
jgi:hypothetical protein